MMKMGEIIILVRRVTSFFASKKHEGWVNLYKWGDDYRYTGEVFSSEERALKSVKGCDSVATIKIEWEE